MSALDRTIALTIFAAREDAEGRRVSMTWRELAAELPGEPLKRRGGQAVTSGSLKGPRNAAKKRSERWSLAVFAEDYRDGESVESVAGIVLDLEPLDDANDAKKAKTRAAQEARGWTVAQSIDEIAELLRGSAAIVATSPTWAPSRPRFRVIVPTDRSMTSAEYPRCARALLDIFGRIADEGASCNAAGLWYSDHLADVDPEVRLLEGEPLRVDDLLALDLPADVSARHVRAPQAAGARSAAGDAVDRYNREHAANADAWPPSGGTCPACEHNGCFGRLPDSDPPRWACHSSGHEGAGLLGNGCHTGDVLDLAAHAAGVDRMQFLRREGYLPPGGAKQRTSLSLTCLSSVRRRSVEWLWQGRIPRGMVTLLDGLPKVGKSLIMVDLAARITTGHAMPGETQGADPANVLVLSHEDDPECIWEPRFAAAQGDPSRLIRINDLVQLPDDGEVLAQAVRDTGAVLLIVDPIAAYFGSGLDENTQVDVRRALLPVQELATATGCAVVLIRHVKKNAEGGAMDVGLGSRAYSAVARSMHLAGRVPADEGGDSCALSHSACTVARTAATMLYKVESVPVEGIPEPVGAVRWGGTSILTSDALLARKTYAAGPRPARVKAASEDLTRIVGAAGGGMLVTEARAAMVAAGHKGVNLQDAARAAAGLLPVRPGGLVGPWWWAVPGWSADESSGARTRPIEN